MNATELLPIVHFCFNFTSSFTFSFTSVSLLIRFISLEASPMIPDLPVEILTERVLTEGSCVELVLNHLMTKHLPSDHLKMKLQ